MNRKNLTTAVLAGLAGVAGLAATAQAVNINPDGLGQILIYPYYTSNDGNQTILSVVNTTDQAKAVKVRFLEGYNSREVLDFNLYMSHHDVWVAAITDVDGTPTLLIPDNSCTVPYLYEDMPDGQPFLDLAYTGEFNDGGPEDIGRAAEGHFEMLEMGTLVGEAAKDATHGEDGVPADCDQLVDNWTQYFGSDNGIWFDEAVGNFACDPDAGVLRGCQAHTDTTRNSGGLFGGAAVVNSENGTMYSYDAKAIQGYDKTDDGVHFLPGSIFPSLNSGNQQLAWVFFGAPQNRAVPLFYPRPVDAISGLFMHENIMNEYSADADLNAATEWVVTFPTKNFYVDEARIGLANDVLDFFWHPIVGDPLCADWEPGDPYPTTKGENGDPIDGPGPWNNVAYGWDWGECVYVKQTILVDSGEAARPFTELFDGEACERAGLKTWDRNEQTFNPEDPGGARPPVVSPSRPGPCDPDLEICDETPFELCYEVNVLRFGDESVFGTPSFGDSSLLLTVENEFENGWGRIHLGTGADPRHMDWMGMAGLPVTGFAAYEFENGFLDGGSVKANYGGLFGHKANVRRLRPLLRIID